MKSPLKYRNLKKLTALSNNKIAKVLYHIDENGEWRKNGKSKDFITNKKLSKNELNKTKLFVKNAKNNGTPTMGKIEDVKKIFTALKKKENVSLLNAVLPLLSKKPITSITESTRDSNIRSYTIYHFDFPDKSNAVYQSELFQHFMLKMHTYARTFIEETMEKSSLVVFNNLYPTMHPRYCFVSSYSEGTMEGIPIHLDQVSFLSIVVALQGDYNDPIENSLRISNVRNPDKKNSKFFRLQNGEAVIFQRLYHSIIPIKIE